MEAILGLVIAHFLLFIWASYLIIKSDLVYGSQKKAQILICLFVPYIGSIIIGLFTLHETKEHESKIKPSRNTSTVSEQDGINLHISHRQHQDQSGND